MGRGQPTSRNGGATPESSLIIFLEQRITELESQLDYDHKEYKRLRDGKDKRIGELEKEVSIFRSDPQFQVCVSQEKYIMRLEATNRRLCEATDFDVLHDRSGRTYEEYRQLYWDARDRVTELEARERQKPAYHCPKCDSSFSEDVVVALAKVAELETKLKLHDEFHKAICALEGSKGMTDAKFVACVLTALRENRDE